MCDRMTLPYLLYTVPTILSTGHCSAVAQESDRVTAGKITAEENTWRRKCMHHIEENS